MRFANRRRSAPTSRRPRWLKPRSISTPARRRTAVQSLTTKRKPGTVGKSQSQLQDIGQGEEERQFSPPGQKASFYRQRQRS